MIADNIGYRYTHDELSALMMLLRLSPPPGMDCRRLSQEDFEQACDGLLEAGLLVRMDESMAVDRLTALILSSASKCVLWLNLSCDEIKVSLWQGTALFVLGRAQERGPIQLTPLRDAQDAAQAVTAEPLRFPVEFRSSDGRSLSLDNHNALVSAVRETLIHAEPSDPNGTEAQ